MHSNIKKVVFDHKIGHDQLHRKYEQANAFHEISIFRELGRHETEAVSDCSLAAELGVKINLVNLKISELFKMVKLSSSCFDIERPRVEFLKDYNPLKDRDYSAYWKLIKDADKYPLAGYNGNTNRILA